MDAVKQITEALAPLFAAMDAEIEARAHAWASRRQAAVKEFEASAEGRALRKNVWAYYEKLHGIAGGKTWYQLFNTGTSEKVAEFVTKNNAAVAEARNAKIAAQLAKAGVTAVTGQELTRTADGFNGLFAVRTDAGVKRVTIQTIHAGGWNIQCFHLRVLVKVK